MAVAVTVTLVPAHTGLELGEMLTLTGSNGFMFTITLVHVEGVQGNDSHWA